jgi:hypothetical protein
MDEGTNVSFLCGRLKGLLSVRAISPFLVQPLTSDSWFPRGLVTSRDKNEKNDVSSKNKERLFSSRLLRSLSLRGPCWF